ncbi:unnamed protein product [Phyllotreta striolata]|uniref:Beta-galactosidase n=1 Tax=Phyllotreta striolata TaxID=444603 RepID=A0A9N9XMK1_PHYSR|nr:unnamed protein product [Phyllotreta striolata]
MALTCGNSTSLPTNYGHYTAGGIRGGITSDKPNFYLNDKEIFLYSGAMHYFRVPRAYWRDRLRKMRAAGLNAVETYVPWNLHEPQSGKRPPSDDNADSGPCLMVWDGKFDFGDGGNDMSDFLHLEEFLKTAQEEDLFAIVRSGPFICAEFEFGGHPSWLLREKSIDFRTTEKTYVSHVTRWFNALLPILAALQFTKGGPVVMLQVENEYSVSGKRDKALLKVLRSLMLEHGIVEQLVTSDNPIRGAHGTWPDLFLMTGNFDQKPKEQFDMLKKIQPGRPTMAMEFWSGWFDFWGGAHTNKTVEEFRYNYEEILKYPASVNIYMFHGGTNFGFLNGAGNLAYDDWNTDYHSIISSYEYLSPLDEAGDYTDKYWATKELLSKYNPVKTLLPAVPDRPKKTAYESIKIEKEMLLYDMLETIKPVASKEVVAMETLDINNGNGQSFGYVVYRKTGLNIPAGAVLKIQGRVCDTVMVLVDGVLVSPWLERSKDLAGFGTWKILDSTLVLSNRSLTNARLELVVENWGRVNVGVYKQFKGLWQSQVKLNDEYITDWSVYPLEFKSAWTKSLSSWGKELTDTVGPAMYKATLRVEGEPVDTFVHMEQWIKGIVIVNGFVLGRYAKMGPIQTLYLPAPLLRTGDNDIIIFEHYKPAQRVDFSDAHIYKRY